MTTEQHYVWSKEYIHVFCTTLGTVMTNLGQPYELAFIIKLQSVFLRYTMILTTYLD
jgi:hypothetical protein